MHAWSTCLHMYTHGYKGHMYIHMHKWIHTMQCIYMNVHKYMCTYKHSYVCICVLTYKSTHAHMYTLRPTSACIFLPWLVLKQLCPVTKDPKAQKCLPTISKKPRSEDPEMPPPSYSLGDPQKPLRDRPHRTSRSGGAGHALGHIPLGQTIPWSWLSGFALSLHSG